MLFCGTLGVDITINNSPQVVSYLGHADSLVTEV